LFWTVTLTFFKFGVNSPLGALVKFCDKALVHYCTLVTGAVFWFLFKVFLHFFQYQCTFCSVFFVFPLPWNLPVLFLHFEQNLKQWAQLIITSLVKDKVISIKLWDTHKNNLSAIVACQHTIQLHVTWLTKMQQ